MNEDVRGEAARLRRRLAIARDRLDAVLDTRGGAGTGGVGSVAGGGARARGGLTRIDDDEVLTLLLPASDRIARLLELTDALADGTLSESSARDEARAVAEVQPFRRPR